MPKMKSHRGARTSYGITASGKIKRRKMNRRHILSTKSRKRKRHLRRATLVSSPDMKRVKRLMVV